MSAANGVRLHFDGLESTSCPAPFCRDLSASMPAIPPCLCAMFARNRTHVWQHTSSTDSMERSLDLGYKIEVGRSAYDVRCDNLNWSATRAGQKEVLKVRALVYTWKGWIDSDLFRESIAEASPAHLVHYLEGSCVLSSLRNKRVRVSTNFWKGLRATLVKTLYDTQCTVKLNREVPTRAFLDKFF